MFRSDLRNVAVLIKKILQRAKLFEQREFFALQYFYTKIALSISL